MKAYSYEYAFNETQTKESKIMTTYSNVKALDTAITTVCNNSGNLKKEIQSVGIGIVAFAAGKGSGNVTRAKTLVDGLGDGVRRDSLVAWFSLVGINFDEEGNVSLDKTMLVVENMDTLKAMDWSSAKPAPNPYKSSTYGEQLAKALKHMYKDFANGQKEGNETLLSVAEVEGFEKFAKPIIGTANMPKRPDSLKAKDTGTTAVSAAA